MPKKVRLQMQFVSVYGDVPFRISEQDESRVHHIQVDGRTIGAQLLSKRRNRPEIRQVEVGTLDGRIGNRLADAEYRRLTTTAIAHGKNHMRAFRCERLRYLSADTAACPRYERTSTTPSSGHFCPSAR